MRDGLSEGRAGARHAALKLGCTNRPRRRTQVALATSAT